MLSSSSPFSTGWLSLSGNRVISPETSADSVTTSARTRASRVQGVRV
ncbi:Uncharacterised protein [Acinetobacter baumannii]|nr:Uncharacterised protein [Acinetobacter baumannii]